MARRGPVLETGPSSDATDSPLPSADGGDMGGGATTSDDASSDRTLYCLALVEDGRRGATLMRAATQQEANELARLLEAARDWDASELLSCPPFSRSGSMERARSNSSVEQPLGEGPAPPSPSSAEGPVQTDAALLHGPSRSAAAVVAAAAAAGVNPVKFGGPCYHCGVADSPQWRRGPAEKPVLCNACGTRYRRTNQLASYAPAPLPPKSSTGKKRLAGGKPAAAAAKVQKVSAL